jgi:ribosomal protein S15P/S13E
MNESDRKDNAEKESKVHISDSSFDESYFKLTKFLQDKPSREKLQKLMKKNPGLVIFVSKDKVEASIRRLAEYMKNRSDQQKIPDTLESQKAR